MARLAFSRLMFAVPVVIAVSILSFVMLRLAPGDPALLQAGLDASPEAIQAIRQQMRLDDPLPLQYLAWASDVLRGDLGYSYSSGVPVTELIARRLPVSAQIAAVALIFIILVGIPAGVISALRRNRPTDQIVRVGSLLGISVPNFVVAIFMVLLFGWWFPNLMPYQGFVRLTDSVPQSLLHTILPAAALAAPQVGLIARLTRSSMLEVVSQDYMTAARAMGVRESVLVLKDGLRNALLPVLTVLGVVTGFLLGGSVVIESVFGIAGLGRLLVESFTQRDYPVTIGVMLFIAIAFVLINIIVDVLYGVVNPRIRYGSGKA